MKKTFGRWHSHQCGNFSATSRLAENGHTARVTSKGDDVCPDPLENSYDVDQLASGLIPNCDDPSAQEWRGYARTWPLFPVPRGMT